MLQAFGVFLWVSEHLHFHVSQCVGGPSLAPGCSGCLRGDGEKAQATNVFVHCIELHIKAWGDKQNLFFFPLVFLCWLHFLSSIY